MRNDSHCNYCGAELNDNESFGIVLSYDEQIRLCYDCHLSENASLVLEEIEDGEELDRLINEFEDGGDW